MMQGHSVNAVSDLEIKIIKFLSIKPNSGIAVFREFSGVIPDRDEASRLVNSLFRRGYVIKQTCGWRITAKSRKLIDEIEAAKPKSEQLEESASPVSAAPSAPPIQEEKPEEQTQETVGVYLDDVPSITEVDQIKSEEVLDSPMDGSIWGSISQVAKQMPEGARLVISEGQAFAEFAGARFGLQRDGDIESLMRMAELHLGEAA